MVKYTNNSRLSVDMEARVAREYGAIEDYSAKIRQLAYNLKHNPELISTYTPQSLVGLDNDTLAKGMPAELWYAEFLKTLAREEELVTQQAVGGDSILKCRKCSSTNLTTNQVQTRGADEPMTVFVNCDDCNTRWRC